MITLIHNPACSKSREALALLQSRLPAASLQVREYLQQPLDLVELKQLGLPARELLRGEPDGRDDDALLGAIAANPELLQRPIVIRDGRALIARPPELALTLLD
ncbi:ArsC/Spx/MgsR family protein [Pelomonas sp. KK5]|uniref:ArsC/Spx/MgsR family protein n=1 Tax=Pelomonas sp. KK5 TaxID=1855730 RepID=UPI00097C4039|nr:ArsC/Spx/MgsR family protein [Pelomonas sp. KK5]